MPLRAYLSPWEATQDEDGMILYQPRIGLPGNYLYENRINHSCIDMRTAEQQGAFPAEGYALVMCNVVPKDHNQIMKIPDTHEVTAGSTVAEIAAVIGTEATDEALDSSTFESAKEYFKAVHKRRVDRWKGRV